MRKLSKIADGLIGQPMFHILARAQELERAGKKIIHFEIGDPNFHSPVHAVSAAKKALDANLTHYTNSMGIREFREAVSQHTELNLGFRPSIEQILICPANAVIDFVTRCVADPGDEIIYPDPGFSTYYSVINYNRMAPVGIPLREENDFHMLADEIRKKITDKTKLIIINSPNNPTGSVLNEKEILEIAEIAEEHDIYLLSDEVYMKIIYDKSHFSPSVIDRCKERTIILNSLSKAYAMSGWRLGYAIGPVKLVEKLGLLLQTIISCLPAFTQHGGIAAILGDQQILTQRAKKLRERRDLLVGGLNRLSGISCVVPEGAFYAFPNIRDTGLTSDEFCKRMLEEAGVCMVSGNSFGKYGEGFVRLCYASTEMEVIEEALNKMEKVLSLLVKV